MDRQLEGRAAEFFQQRKYAEAIEVYSQCLGLAKERNDQVNLLLNRASCYLKQGKFSEAQADCDKILLDDSHNEKALWKKNKVLCFQGKFQEALSLTTGWIEVEPENPLAQKELKRLEIVMSALKDQDGEDESPVSAAVQISTGNGISEVRPTPEGREAVPQSSPTSNPTSNLPSLTPFTSSQPDDDPDSGIQKTASIIGVSLKSNNDSVVEENGEKMSSDLSPLHKEKPLPNPVNYQWKHRPPPRGLTSDEYSLCLRFQEMGRCTFGEKCTQAHSVEELIEWKERFDLRRQRLQKAREKNVQGSTSIEQLQEKLLSAENTESVITERLDVAKVHCNGELKVDMSSKKCSHSWMFTVTSRIPLQRVLLLDDTYRSYFFISSVSKGPKKMQKHQNIDTNCQEWMNPDNADLSGSENVCRLKIVFKADIYGTFRQTVVFDYGSLPVLGQLIQVDSAPPAEANRFTKDLLLNAGNRWDSNSVSLVEFHPILLRKSVNEQRLKKMYMCPHPEKFNLSRALFEPLCKENYRKRMHELLFIEEMEQFGSISRYNVKATLQLVNRFLLIPGTLSTAKYAHNGELFSRMKIEDDLSEDSVHGRLILQNCQTAWIMPDATADNPDQPNKVYEALIEDKGKNFIFLRLSAACVANLKLTCDQDFKAQIQFQLNRLPLCEMHYGVDKLPSLSLVFPDLGTPPAIPWTPDRQWTNIDSKLNAKQKEAVIGITAPTSLKLPPILLCGPYGTGKTYTLAQAAKLVLKEKETRILICTHSNSAADLYIRDFLHPYVMAGHPEASPLRIYYRYRWTQTVPESVLPYCLLGEVGSGENFRLPTKLDLEQHRVVVTTLSTSRYLCDLDLKPGYFTHIFLDEAAQSMECESLLPMSMAGETTRIVLAGDHMQLSPEVCSAFVKERDLHRSLLERLYDAYSTDFPCKILLCENYRSHESIVSLTSELFYDSKLVASGKQPAHESFYPLTFFTAKGEEVQHMNSTGFYNMAEIYEVVDRVEELQKTWPKSWGDLCETSIGIVAPYADQVVRIRSELRKRKMYRVSVERVLNVQGKQFRAILLSAVRTRLTCSTDSAMEDLLDYGFLSNVKLLNTAITRAQSLVAVVGDPVSLCAVGKCRKVWEHFIKLCNTNKSLHGTTWQQLRVQLDGLEMKRTYVLNPNAPEFIPNQLRHGARLPGDMLGYSPYLYMNGHRVAYYPGFQPQLIHPYMTGPVYNPPFSMYTHPWTMPHRFIKHLPGGPHRPGKGSRLSPVSRGYVPPNQSPPTQRMATQGGSAGEGVRHPPDGEAITSAGPQTSSANIKSKTPMKFPKRQMANGSVPFYPRAGVPHLLPHPAQIPYGMFIPDDPRFYMVPGGYPPQFGFVPMGAVPYPAVPRYLPPFPSGPPHPGFGGYHPPQHPQEEQRQSPNSSNRSTPGSYSSGPSRPASTTDMKSYSPSSSPNSFQQVQLLPNVKHAPAHLMHPESPHPDSRNSPAPKVTRDQSPIGITSASPAGKGIKHPRPVSAYTERSVHVNKAYTGPAPHSQRVKMGQISPGKTLTLEPPDPALMARPPLNRQYSEELQTPTQIHDLMKMIEENTQDSPNKHHMEGNPLARVSGSEVARSAARAVPVSHLYKPSPGAHSKELKVNINLANSRQKAEKASPSPRSAHTSETVVSPPSTLALPENSDKPTYAGVLRRPPPSPQPQTPVTPAVFPPTTPREQMGNDAMDILRNLNIKASPGTQALYQYFS